MLDIHNPGQYPPNVLAALQQMPPLALDIANRWSRDWPSEAAALIAAGQFLGALSNQVRDERWAINKAQTTNRTAEAVAARHFLFPDPPPVVMEADIPESGPWEGSPQCVIEVSEPFELEDGRLTRVIKSRHSDGFVCLRFEDFDPSIEAEGEKTESEPRTSIWSRRRS